MYVCMCVYIYICIYSVMYTTTDLKHMNEYYELYYTNISYTITYATRI